MLNPGEAANKRLAALINTIAVESRKDPFESANSIAVFQLYLRNISVVKPGPGSEVVPSPGIRSGRASTLSSFATATGIGGMKKELDGVQFPEVEDQEVRESLTVERKRRRAERTMEMELSTRVEHLLYPSGRWEMKPKEKKGQEAYICVFGAVREKFTMDGQSIQPREE
ncbi:hypothetical protein ACFE04_019700 [Oxalis oulophora]